MNSSRQLSNETLVTNEHINDVKIIKTRLPIVHFMLMTNQYKTII